MGEVAATTASMSNLNVSVDESKTVVASSSQPEVKIAESEVVDGAVAKVDPVVRGPRPGARGVEGGEEGEEEPVRLLQEEGRPHGICMQVWRYVLRDPPLQRQARLHVRLRCSRQV